MAKEETTVIEKFQGNMGCLILLIIFFWPAGIVYFFLNRRPVKIKIEEESTKKLTTK